MLPDDPRPSRALDELKRLTGQAVTAAEQGDWDTVRSCIDERESLVGQVVIPPTDAIELRALDGRIEAALLVAREGTASALAEIGRIRNNVERLQRQSDGYRVVPSSIFKISA